MPLLTARIDDAAKMQFRALARSRGQSESEFLRSLVQLLIARSEVDACVPSVDSRKCAQARMTIRLPQFLVDGVVERSVRKGMKPSRWVAALVQSHLMALPVMTEGEVQALRASNRELAAIGRNLNQIARRLNAAFHDTEQVRLGVLMRLTEVVDRQQASLHALVRASQGSWGGELED